MNEPIQSFAPPPDAAPNLPAPFRGPLTTALVAAGDAVHNELRKANELAAGLDAQLVGRSKEVLHLKFVLERTKAHFGHLQDSVAALRKERHQLANDVMRAEGLGMMLAKVTTERDRLKTDLSDALQSCAIQNAQAATIVEKRDQAIAALTFDIVKLRQELAEVRRNVPSPATVEPLPTHPTLNALGADDLLLMPKVEIVATEHLPARRGRW